MKRNNRIKPLSSAGRREFLRATAKTSALGVAGPMALNLSALTHAAAAGANDYKAMVCVFLYGGNDHFNTVAPYDSYNHRYYSEMRGTLATSRDDLEPTKLNGDTLPDGKRFALAPQMTKSHELWSQGSLGVQLSVGPLMEPTTKQQYENGTVELPPRMFAHNSQQGFWQSLVDGGSNANGWGGRLADRMLSQYGTSPFNTISLFGQSTFLNGQVQIATNVSPDGDSLLTANNSELFGQQGISDAALNLMTARNTGLYASAHTTMMRRSINATEKLNNAFANSSALATQFDPESGLSNQLKNVAELMSVRDRLNVNRQIYFVGIGGFDTHGSLVGSHPALLTELDGALKEFYDATVELGISDKVTTFTASEFGRTLNSNGDGSDHGWGAHQLIMGDDVDGRRFYGHAPEMSSDSENLIDRGRLLPTTSIEQFGAELGRWFGATPGDLSDVFARLDRFDSEPLGIFR